MDIKSYFSEIKMKLKTKGNKKSTSLTVLGPI